MQTTAYKTTLRHVRSRDKDGSRKVAENPMLHANVTALCFTERKLLPIEVLHCGNRNFRSFGSCDLDLNLDPMTFIYELDSIPCRIHRTCE